MSAVQDRRRDLKPLKSIKVGKQIRFDPEGIDRFLQGEETNQPKETADWNKYREIK